MGRPSRFLWRTQNLAMFTSPLPQAWANDCKTLFYVTKDKLDRWGRLQRFFDCVHVRG